MLLSEKEFREVYRDAKRAYDLLRDDEKDLLNYKKIYLCSNENLVKLFSRIVIYGKNVFSILSSSDQYFTLKYLGAETVDTFDINKLTFYYYYLRKWNIEILNNEYFDSSISKNELVYLLNHVNPSSEEERKALLFWRILSNRTYNLSNLFERSNAKRSFYYDDLDSLKRNLMEPISFSCLDFFDELNISRKYDLIVLSNILEYGNNPFRYEVARKNIERLLNKNGICLCSYFIDSSHIHGLEVSILTKGNLEYEDLNLTYLDSHNHVKEVGYVYKKRG